MNHQGLVHLFIDRAETLGEAIAFVESVPKNFVERSKAFRAFRINPKATLNDITKEIDGWGKCRLVWSYVRHSDDSSEERMLVSGDEKNVIQLHVTQGSLIITIYSSDEDADLTLGQLCQRLHKFEMQNLEDDGVWHEVSYMDKRGNVKKHSDFIRTPKWDDIAANYARKTKGSIRDIMAMKAPWETGRLLIWHGEAGTGKTFAIRALMMAWRELFNYVFVSDPETFTASPEYYYQLCSESQETQYKITGPGQWRPDFEHDASPFKRTLFVMEDAADLIMPESRNNHFDKIGKLLNLTDGLFGQGREDMFMVTFNEKLERIDPAFLRPGRCVANVEFEKLSAAETSLWLALHGGVLAPKGTEMTIAELYEQMHRIKKAEIKKEVTIEAKAPEKAAQ